MTDRELLEAAAKAAGLDLDWCENTDRPAVRDQHGGASYWNPLEDDGDALRLAVALRMEVTVRPAGSTWADIGNGAALAKEQHDADPYAATRRAIVRAAAEIGRKA